MLPDKEKAKEIPKLGFLPNPYSLFGFDFRRITILEFTLTIHGFIQYINGTTGGILIVYRVKEFVELMEFVGIQTLNATNAIHSLFVAIHTACLKHLREKAPLP